jgi:hypothetical protein
VLSLTISSGGCQAPPTPNEADPNVTVWRDLDGAVCAYGQTVNGEHWVHVPGVGAFRIASDREDVVALSLPSASPECVRDTYRRTVLPLSLQALGREVLHASAVRMPAGVVAFCAVSGTGKSTVVGGLSQRGHALWADDAVCFDATGQDLEVLPLPFSLRLRPAAAAFFGDWATEDGSDPGTSPAPFAAVFVLERSATGGAAVDLRPLPPGEAFLATLTHGYCFSLQDDERRRALVRAYLDLAGRVPVFKLVFNGGLERLGEMLDLIEEACPTEQRISTSRARRNARSVDRRGEGQPEV